MRIARQSTLMVCLLLVAACSSTVPSPSPTPSVAPGFPVRVLLGLYSGRPDPEWQLTEEQASRLAQALSALPVVTNTPPDGGLGYHGFTIEFPDRTLVAYRGVVASQGVGPRSVIEDPTRSIERLLLESGRPHINPDESAEVARALAIP